MKEINVAFAGNPNCGKTTLFNAYTGARLKVANWPGVTVEKKEGRMKFNSASYKLVDLPGTYSLTSYTMEERLTRDYLINGGADVIIDVADASSLERNLYLTLQLIELGKPVVLALNMMDIVRERGMKIDLHRLAEMLGIAVVPVCARQRSGLEELMSAAADFRLHRGKCLPVYSDGIENKLEIVISILRKKYPDLRNLRWYALRLLEHDEELLQRYPVDLSGIADDSLESELINERYDFIGKVIAEVLVNKEEKSAATDRIDAVLTHRFFGLPIFLLIMAAVFFLTFTVGDLLKGYFELGIEGIGRGADMLLRRVGAGAMMRSLVTDGIIAGVGGVLTFLPNIFMLFLALAFLEDSGYMSRVSYIMDRIMGRLGLSGRAFIPMLLGFGCSVPAVMASRALEDINDRKKTMLVTPFMSCSARLPVYVLLSRMFFGKYAFFAAYSMYLIGAVTAATALLVMSRTKRLKSSDLLIELPEYKTPNLRTIVIYVWEKISDYIEKAGTTIFAASVILWVLLNFNAHGMTDEMGGSFAAQIGHLLAPCLAPAGLGYWQIAVALLSGIAAKEVVVSSMGVLFGVANVAASEGMAALSGALGAIGFGAANAYSMMLFCLLYVPCMATIATLKREACSAKFALGAALLQLGTAWVVSTAFYRLAMLIM